MKNKVLIIVGGIWEPAISIAGTKILYKLIKKISEKDENIHVLTTVSSWADKNYEAWYIEKEKELGIKFHFIKATLFENIPALNLVITRIQLLFKAYSLNKKYGFSLVHDFVSSTLLFSSSYVYKKIMNMKVIYSVITFNKKFNKNYNFLYNINNIDKIICGSQYTYSCFRDSLIDNNKIEFLPIGLNLSDYRSLEIDRKYIQKCNLDNTKKVILFVGPLEERKGIFLFLKCLKKIITQNDNILAVVASFGKSNIDPNHEKNKKILIDNIGKKNIRFLKGKQDIKQLMIRSQIMTLPYTSLHGTLVPPVTLLEAMASGCNIITSDLNEIKDILDKSEGIYFKKNNLKEYVEKTNNCLNEKTDYGKRARIKVFRDYDIDKNTNKLLEIYKKV